PTTCTCCCYTPSTLVPTLPAPMDTPSLHDALPILQVFGIHRKRDHVVGRVMREIEVCDLGYLSCSEYHQAVHTSFRTRIVNSKRDRKSTRLNSSHRTISYAVFCLKKKKNSRK